jgi:acyl-homoserine lactone acylase PvdQ
MLPFHAFSAVLALMAMTIEQVANVTEIAAPTSGQRFSWWQSVYVSLVGQSSHCGEKLISASVNITVGTSRNIAAIGYPRIVGPVDTERKARTRGAFTEIDRVLAEGRFTRQSLQDFMLSNRNYAAELTVDDLTRMYRSLPDLADACDVLSTWDRRNDVGSRGALLFDRFWLKATATAGAELWRVPFSAADPVNTPNTLNTANPAVARALTDAVAELRAAGIALDAPFGDHHYVVRGGERIPIGGGTASAVTGYVRRGVRPPRLG